MNNPSHIIYSISIFKNVGVHIIMRRLFFIVPILSLLGGCFFTTTIPSDTQTKWQGRPISELQQAIGPGGGFNVGEKGERYYYRRKSGDVLLTGSKYPLGGYVHKSCELRVYIDNQDRITRFVTLNKGANCAYYDQYLK